MTKHLQVSSEPVTDRQISARGNATGAAVPENTRKLPPDPDGMNDRRAAWAAQAIATFRLATGTEEEDALTDLLADILHWCDRKGQNFEETLHQARIHYEAETDGEPSTF